MKILLAPYGTRGDVQPLIALGIALRDRGHRVEVSAPDNFRAWIGSFGLVFHPVGLDMEQLLCAAGDKIRSLTWMMKHLSQDLIPAQFNSLPQTFPDADIIVGAGLQFAGASVAEHRGVPYVMVAYCPVAFPSSQHPAPNIKSQRLPRIVNRLTWALGAVGADLMLRASMNRSRGRLGLGHIAGAASHLISGNHTILAADPSLAPAPPDLRAGIVRVDSLVLEEGGSLDEELSEFLSAGAPPIYVGFGMTWLPMGQTAPPECSGCRRVGGRSRLPLGSGGPEGRPASSSKSAFRPGAGLSRQFRITCSSLVVPRLFITEALGLRRPSRRQECRRSSSLIFWISSLGSSSSTPGAWTEVCPLRSSAGRGWPLKHEGVLDAFVPTRRVQAQAR
jgi:hypothetical protein